MAIHRTAMGKSVDMSSLSSQHEKTRAVGNMNVNARGDIVDSNNRVIQDNTKRVKATYNNSVADHLTPSAAPVSVPVQAPAMNSLVADEPVELTEAEKELFDADDEEEVVSKKAPKK
jgi:hypothetical protein